MRLRGLAALPAPLLAAAALTLLGAAPAGAATAAPANGGSCVTDGGGMGWPISDEGHNIPVRTAACTHFSQVNVGGPWFQLKDANSLCITANGGSVQMESCASTQQNHWKWAGTQLTLQATGDNMTASFVGSGSLVFTARGAQTPNNTWKYT